MCECHPGGSRKATDRVHEYLDGSYRLRLQDDDFETVILRRKPKNPVKS